MSFTCEERSVQWCAITLEKFSTRASRLHRFSQYSNFLSRKITLWISVFESFYQLRYFATIYIYILNSSKLGKEKQEEENTIHKISFKNLIDNVDIITIANFIFFSIFPNVNKCNKTHYILFKQFDIIYLLLNLIALIVEGNIKIWFL